MGEGWGEGNPLYRIENMLKRHRFIIVNVLLLMGLTGSLYGRSIESAKVKETHFISGLDLPFRDWKIGPDGMKDNEKPYLEPDDWYIHDYVSPKGLRDGWIQFAVIAGHRKKTVHTPGFCMVGGGWDVITAQNSTLQVDGQTIPISRSVMSNEKEGGSIIVSFFFTDGEHHTPSLVRYQMEQLKKRFVSRDIPVGALVRIITFAGGGTPPELKKADALIADFAAATLPKVLKSMRETKLEVL
jgi:EpsI family protein